MQTLIDKLHNTDAFLIGAELVSIRGNIGSKDPEQVRNFSMDLADCPQIDWISMTDNAGGDPQLAPQTLGKPILSSGKEVLIHLTCKDLNRNGLESAAWSLNREGFHNILAMTGDYPIAGNHGLAKPSFDLDSVGLISMLNKMNEGFSHIELIDPDGKPKFEATNFLVGAVTTNYKLLEGELVPQYLKLEKKVEAGARFIINQVGYDARKMHELRLYMDLHGMKETPLIGNVYILNQKVANLFNKRRIPGIFVSDELLAICEVKAKSPDKGQSFFEELAAKHIAIYKGLGYRGAYLGGAQDRSAIERVLEIERSFAPDDWKEFAKEMAYARHHEYFYFIKDTETGLSNLEGNVLPSTIEAKRSLGYRLSKWTDEHIFKPDSFVAKLGSKACETSKDPMRGPGFMRLVERMTNAAIYRCANCGDCSLPETAYLCPESRCPKNQRNGPCGGTRDGQCEVDGYKECVWLTAYDRLRGEGKERALLDHPPMLQNHSLRNTSAWANRWLERDHVNKK